MRLLQKALTFDDVLLVPAHSAILPRDVSLKTRLTRNITLNLPLASVVPRAGFAFLAAAPRSARMAFDETFLWFVALGAIAAELMIGIPAGIFAATRRGRARARRSSIWPAAPAISPSRS